MKGLDHKQEMGLGLNLGPIIVGPISPCRVRKRTRYKPPAMRVRDEGYTKKSPTSV